MTTLGYSPLIQNQLQFNLGVPPSVGNCATKQRRPGPIVIEKLGAPAQSPKQSNSPMRFSTISEEDMEIAVRLARRDLKKKREEIEMEQYLQKMAERASPKVDKKEEERKKARERLLIGTSRARVGKQTQTKPTSSGKVMRPRVNELRSEVRPHSPPTRDTDNYPSKLSQDERTALEIRRLRRELKSYVEEIGKIDSVLSRPEPSDVTDDLTDEEYYSKRRARALGRATRSTRMIYDLKQQIRAIYDDIQYMKLDEEPRKRSDVIKRLAFAHRATVRALQDLAHQIPEAGTDDVSKISRELAQLIQQLTDCCQELEIADGKESQTTSVSHRESARTVVPNVWKEVVEGPIEFRRENKPYRPEPVREEMDDERTTALKEGLASLLKSRTPEKKVDKPSVVIETKPKVMGEHRSKGMLIKRPKKKSSQKVRSVDERPRYTEATISHRSKQKEPVEWSSRSRSRSRSPVPRSPRIVNAGVIEKLNLGVPNEWAEQAETAIKHRLEPLLQRAARISSAERRPDSMRNILSEKALDRIECHSGLLVDLILDDLCKDAAVELMNLETEEKIDRDANLMLQGSELHTLMDKLDLIDREQREIRERWNSVKYSDRTEFSRVKLSEVPKTPEPTVMDTEVKFTRPGVDLDFAPRQKVEKSPIIFTNETSIARLRSERLDLLRNEALKNEYGLVEIPHKPSILTENEVDDIHQYRKLRLVTQRKTERSCRTMDAITDEILNDLLNSAAEEMMATSSEMDNQLCMQELALGQSIQFSDTDNIISENLNENDRFPVKFDDDSCMDLHDMINDDDVEGGEGEVAKASASFHGNGAGIHGDRLAGVDLAHVRQQSPSYQENVSGFHSDRLNRSADGRQVGATAGHHGNEGDSRHSNDERDDDEDVHQDDDVDDIRRELDLYEVGHLESVARESSDDDDDDDGPHSNLLGDVNDLEPIRVSGEAEEVQTEEEEEEEEEAGDVEYSSEFVTTTGTGDDSTGQDTAR